MGLLDLPPPGLVSHGRPGAVALLEETALTARIVALSALVLASIALAACATSPPVADAPAEAAPSGFERVVVAPLNVPVRAPAEVEGKGEPVWQELLGYFQQGDRQVAVLAPLPPSACGSRPRWISTSPTAAPRCAPATRASPRSWPHTATSTCSSSPRSCCDRPS